MQITSNRFGTAVVVNRALSSCILQRITYAEMLIIYGECGNEVNPHALFL
jgi:hypothetical protein